MEEGKVFKILAIDGGGIKGLYSSTILEQLESKYGGQMSDYFDLICGTSTGGLIALALSLKIPAAEISKLYLEKGAIIFPHRGKWRQYFWKGKYSDEPLRKVLQELFGDRTLSESNNLLCIPSYSITDARPVVFKFDHREGNLCRDNKANYVDIALATSAAPTYFPITELPYYENKQFIDGGVWANNPAFVGLLEALTYFVGHGKEFASVKVLSVGSLTKTSGMPTGISRFRSALGWRQYLLDTFFVGQSSFTEYIMKTFEKTTKTKIDYVRIPSVPISAKQEHLVQMDLATKNSLNLLRGKGKDAGFDAANNKAIADFFSFKKHYKTQSYGR
jgi:patatin-like phospholipase/acyl hydrolase